MISASEAAYRSNNSKEIRDYESMLEVHMESIEVSINEAIENGETTAKVYIPINVDIKVIESIKHTLDQYGYSYHFDSLIDDKDLSQTQKTRYFGLQIEWDMLNKKMYKERDE